MSDANPNSRDVAVSQAEPDEKQPPPLAVVADATCGMPQMHKSMLGGRREDNSAPLPRVQWRWAKHFLDATAIHALLQRPQAHQEHTAQTILAQEASLAACTDVQIHAVNDERARNEELKPDNLESAVEFSQIKHSARNRMAKSESTSKSRIQDLNEQPTIIHSKQ